jgi:hypothetical protein
VTPLEEQANFSERDLQTTRKPSYPNAVFLAYSSLDASQSLDMCRRSQP